MDVAAPAPLLEARAPAVPAARSFALAAVLGWLVPGLGQLYVGRPLKALLMAAAIGGLFVLGLALTGFTCVDPDAYELEFFAHALLGAPTALTYHLTQAIELTEPLPHFEVGRLYAAVAGLLNVVAICDALGEVVRHNRHVGRQRALRAHFLAAREAALEAALDESTLDGSALDGDDPEGTASAERRGEEGTT